MAFLAGRSGLRRAFAGMLGTATFASALALSVSVFNPGMALAQESVWMTYFTEGFKALQGGDFENSEKMFSSAADAAKAFGDSDQRYFKTLDGLALAQAGQRKFADAESTYQKVLAVKEKALGADSAEACISMSNYADLLITEGKFKQAEIMYQACLKTLANFNPTLYAEKSQNYGLCLSEEGLYDRAEEALQNARQKEIDLYGIKSIQSIQTQTNLINLHYTRGAYKQARKEALDALQMAEQLTPSNLNVNDAIIAALSQIDLRMGHFDQAEKRARLLIEHASDRADATSSDLPRSFERLADIYLAQQQYVEAEKLLVKAKAMLQKQFPNHPFLSDCLLDLGELYMDQGRYDDAMVLLQQSLTIRKASYGSEHSDLADCLIDIAYIQAQQNNQDEAEITYQKALSIKKKTVGTEHPDYANALCKLGLLYAAEHKTAEAESALSEALKLREKILPPDHPDLVTNMSQLADFYRDNNMAAKAEPLYLKIKSFNDKYRPNNTAAKVNDLNNLSAVQAMLGKGENASQMKAEATKLRKVVPGGKAEVDQAALAKISGGAAAPITDKWCLCVGISNFQDSTINLQYAAKDATDFRNFLVAKGNFREDHVKLLTDATATRENILAQLGDKWLGKVAKPTDLVIVYISSHGSQAMQKANGTNFLVAYDSNKSSLLASGIPMQWLSEMVKEQMKSNRILLILDVCHSGSVADADKNDDNVFDSADANGTAGGATTNGTATSDNNSAGGKGILRTHDLDVSTITAGAGQIVLCSSAADQVSWESKEYPNSVFTKRLIEAMQSKGTQTYLSDAYKLMKAKVEEEVLRDRSVVQTPIIKENWLGGEVSPLIAIPAQQ